MISKSVVASPEIESGCSAVVHDNACVIVLDTAWFHPGTYAKRIGIDTKALNKGMFRAGCTFECPAGYRIQTTVIKYTDHCRKGINA